MTTRPLSGREQVAGAVRKYWQALALGVVLATGLMGFLISPAPELSRPRLGLFLLGLGIYALLALAVTTPRHFWAVFALLPAVALVVSAIAFASTAWLTYKFPPAQLVVDMFPRAELAALQPENQAPGLHPNPTAAGVAMLLLPMLGVLLFGPASRAERRGGLRLLIAACTLASLPLLVYMPLSLARGALLAVAAAGLALLLARGWAWALVALALAGGLTLAVASALPPTLVDKLLYSDLLTPETYAGPMRSTIWAQSRQLSEQAPLTGIGLGAFPAVYQQADTRVPLFITHAHNIVLQAALDLGWPGALAYMALLAGAAFGAARAGWRLSRGARAGAAYGLAAAVLAFVIFGMLDAITLTAKAGLIVWYVVGLAAAAGRVWGSSAPPAPALD
jgi:putative inorganic carbon (hco3(-)) transporter